MIRTLNPKIKLEILRRDKWTCIYCGGIAQEVDHVVPISKGGPTITGNSVASCHSCNMKKRGGLPISFITRGLFYLSMIGENTSWVDATTSTVVNEKDIIVPESMPTINIPTDIVELLLQSELSQLELDTITEIINNKKW